MLEVLAEERHQTFSVDVAGPITTECDGAILRSGSRSSAASLRTLRDWFPNRKHTQPFEGNGSGCLHERPPEIDAPSSDGIRASRAFVRLPEQCGTPYHRQRFRVPLPHHLLGEITVIHGFHSLWCAPVGSSTRSARPAAPSRPKTITRVLWSSIGSCPSSLARRTSPTPLPHSRRLAGMLAARGRVPSSNSFGVTDGHRLNHDARVVTDYDLYDREPQ